MQIVKQIPNLITLSNLLSGCIAIVIILTGILPIEYAFICTLYSLMADFFDGLVARLLKAQSPMGLQLDSLADMVSFGVVPALVIFYCFLSFVTAIPVFFIDDIIFFIPYTSFFITLGSAYRLAKFNIDTEQSTYFKGLATPANTVLCFGVYFILKQEIIPANYIPAILIIFSCVSTWLLVCNLPLFSLKFKSPQWKDLMAPILLIIFSVILFLFLGLAALAPIIILYIILSIIFKKSFVK